MQTSDRRVGGRTGKSKKMRNGEEEEEEAAALSCIFLWSPHAKGKKLKQEAEFELCKKWREKKSREEGWDEEKEGKVRRRKPIPSIVPPHPVKKGEGRQKLIRRADF